MGDHFIIVCDFDEHNVIKNVFVLSLRHNPRISAVPDHETITVISDSPRLFQDCFSVSWAL